jgi:DedD protein
MAKAISDEQLQLRKRARRRLIGAIALVSVTAVVLPMFLDSEPRPLSQDVNIQIPAPGNAGVFPPTGTASPGSGTQGAPDPATRRNTSPVIEAAPTGVPPVGVAPSGPAGAKTATGGRELVSAPDADRKAKAAAPKAGASAAPEPPAAVEATPRPGAKSPVASPAEPGNPAEAPKAIGGTTEAKGSAQAGGFVVQVAALRDAGKVSEVQSELKSKGIASFTEAVSTKGGTVTRVRIGPFPTREAAEKRRDELAAIGFSGNVVPR